MSIEKILVVDDDDLSREYLCEALQRNGFSVESAVDGREAVNMINSRSYDMVFLDMKMPKMNGLEVLDRIKKVSNETIVVIMTAYGTIETAVEAMKKEAYDYVIKPFSIDQIEMLLKRVQERQKLIDENKYWRSRSSINGDYELIINEQSKMHKVIKDIEKIAQSKASVLIQGESGTGKELVAHAIYSHSQRNTKPFIKVNCAALSENLLESELFGHERGAFTGADTKRIGRFELADGGTLLLDEISEISPNIQAKLLRVLEQEEFERVGGSKTLKVDVRVIATTNRDIPLEIERNNFRQDLYFRLNVIPVMLPPLRERKEDIPVLVDHFLNKFASQSVRRGCGTDSAVQKTSKDAMEMLTQYYWPGNIRELKNLIHRCTVMIDSDILLPKHFESMLNINNIRKKNKLSVGQTIEDVEKALIYKTLEDTGGNKTRTAEILNITARTLRNKLNKYRELQSYARNDTEINDECEVVEESFSR